MKHDFIKFYAIFIILLTGLFWGIDSVHAESFTSEYISIVGGKPFSYEGEDINIKNATFYKWDQNENNEGNLNGRIDYIADTNYTEINFTVYYYDIDNNLVAVSKKKETFYRNYQFQRFMNVLLSKGDFIGDANIEDIASYKISYYTVKPSTSSTSPNVNTTTKNDNPNGNADYSYLDYIISSYNVDITVNKNNVLDITETITARFNIPKHGIIRTIPYLNTVTRLDGTASKNYANISDLTVDDEFKTKKSNGEYEIRIGSTTKTITGNKTYKIKYKYNLGKDPLKDKDELYYNLIGTEWDTTIENITFTVRLPKEFDKEKLGFSSGYASSIDNSKIEYEVKGNTITGKYKGILKSRQGITVRCEFEEGYFEGAKNYVNPVVYISIVVSILFIAISFILWFKYGKDDLVVETVEFYPPENMNSLEAGFIYNGKAYNRDVTSLLIYLANKGYLKITDKQIDLKAEKVGLSSEAKEKAEKKILELENLIKKETNTEKIKYYENMLNIYKEIDKPVDYKQYGLSSVVSRINKEIKFTIEKLKDYDGINAYEEIFMNGLFEYGKTETNGALLCNNFYTTNNQIKNIINKKSNREQIFEKSATTKKKYFVIMLLALYCLITIPAILESDQPLIIPFAIAFPAIGLSVLFGLVTNGIKTFKTSKVASIVEILFGIIWCLGFGGIPGLFLVLPSLLIDKAYLISFIIGLIALITIAIFMINMSKRTKYGTEMLGKLRGFKRFLETAEKEKLEALVQENPTYYYDILPYTYVLGVSDKWIKKFETISLREPDWYESGNGFNVISFNTFMTSTMKTAETSMSSTPYSSSGGSSGGSSSSSGGGSSGGGSGGGGGSSW